MIISHTIKDLQEIVSSLKKINKSVSFVPTMGALHQGHMSLVQLANEAADISVVSIFVNPTQFNEKTDLDNYPRTTKKDCEMLENNQCDIVFIPSVEEIYPEKISFSADYGILSDSLEGAKRPGHFDGVVTVVKRLFEIVQPHVAFFGEKDFQQLAIIRAMTKQYNFDIRVEGAPIIRETSGLAMSSRNRLLSDKDVETALNLSQTLKKCVEDSRKKDIESLLTDGKKKLQNIDNLSLEYFEIVDSASFISIDKFNPDNEARVLVAAYVGEVRLIDNMAF